MSLEEIVKELKAIRKELEHLAERMENFMGFFSLTEEELSELDRDIEAYEKGELDTVPLSEVEE